MYRLVVVFVFVFVFVFLLCGEGVGWWADREVSRWKIVGGQQCACLSARSGWLSVPCPDLESLFVMSFE